MASNYKSTLYPLVENMKTTLKVLIATGALVAASAHASLVNINFNPNAAAAEAAFLQHLNGANVTENFNTMGTAARYVGNDQNLSWENANKTFSTKVGTFTLVTAGQGSTSWSDTTNANNGSLTIESKKTGESGRESLASSKTDLWLDSNDARLVTWVLGAPLHGNFNAFGFYLADANDAGGILSLKFTDNSTTVLALPPKMANLNLGYVTVVSTKSIINATLTFSNNSGADGWGIDDVTVGHIVEPGTLTLMLVGLLGLSATRRRLKA